MRTEIVTPQGTRIPHEWQSKPRDAGARLHEMYRLIGDDCHTVEHVALRGGGHLWMDEDGKAHALEYNPIATQLLHASGGALTDFVVGTVIVETPERKRKP